jgi:radical SAM superfamily enzyme YgiQ (UPF0313 family)
MSKLLLSLPYEASTNKYSRYFPFPLALLKYKEEGDELIDLNLMCYDIKKEEKYKILDEYLEKLNSSEYDEYFVQVGDYAPDADKYEYFEYFLERFEKPCKLIGPYAMFKDRHTKFENISVKEIYTNTYGVMIPEAMLPLYPDGNKILRATMRISNGCPRKCAFCPVPIIHDGKYKMEDIDESVTMIEQYYNMGVKLIVFIDDNMGVNKRKFKKFLQTIKDKNFKGLKFISLEGFETYMFEDEEICQLLKDTKWLNIKTGMENINEDFLAKVNKYYDDHSVIVRAMENIRKHKLDVSVYYLIGLDETEDVVMDNIRFIAKYRLGVRVNILRPYENGLLDFKSFERKMTPKKMKEMSSLTYAVSWLGTQHDIDLFEENALEKILEKAKLNMTINENEIIFTGKVWIGFKTSKLIKCLAYLLNDIHGEVKRLRNDKKEIVFEIIKQTTQDVEDLFE